MVKSIAQDDAFAAQMLTGIASQVGRPLGFRV